MQQQVYECHMNGVTELKQRFVIQMMHSSKWTLKYDEPEVENVARGLSPSVTCSTERHHILMSHEGPCFICFVVWPTTSLKLYIVF